MATRIKTIEYCLSSSMATKANNATFTFVPINVYIPETTGRVFRSAWIELWMDDFYHLAPQWQSYNIHSNIYTGSNHTLLVTSSIANTGENQVYNVYQDVTDCFIQQYGAANTRNGYSCSFQHSGSQVNNINGKLSLTYEYDDAANTRIKTVAIPLQATTSFTTTLTQFDSVEALDTYCPEANKSFRDVWLEVQGSDMRGAVNNVVLTFVVGNVSASTAVQTGSQNSQRYHEYYLPILSNGLDTSLPMPIKGQVSNASITCTPNAYTLKATYEYDESATSTVLNTPVIAIADESGFMAGPANLPGEYTRDFVIEESDPIVSKRNGVYHFFGNAQTQTFVTAISGSTFNLKSYSMAGSAMCGGHALSTCWHSGSFNGNQDAVTLQRGSNRITNVFYNATTANRASTYSAYAVLNYHSGKSTFPGGSANHSDTRKYFLTASILPSDNIEFTSSIIIPESEYYINGMGICGAMYRAVAEAGVSINVANDTGSKGWSDIYSSIIYTDAEAGHYRIFAKARDVFQKYPNGYDTSGYNIQHNPRYVRFNSTNTSNRFSGAWWVTYRTFTYDVSGSISGYTGDGSNITCSLFRDDDNIEVKRLYTTAGGNFSTKWYYNTIPCYVVAYQDSTHLGRSATVTASLPS